MSDSEQDYLLDGNEETLAEALGIIQPLRPGEIMEISSDSDDDTDEEVIDADSANNDSHSKRPVANPAQVNHWAERGRCGVCDHLREFEGASRLCAGCQMWLHRTCVPPASGDYPCQFCELLRTNAPPASYPCEGGPPAAVKVAQGYDRNTVVIGESVGHFWNHLLEPAKPTPQRKGQAIPRTPRTTVRRTEGLAEPLHIKIGDFVILSRKLHPHRAKVAVKPEPELDTSGGDFPTAQILDPESFDAQSLVCVPLKGTREVLFRANLDLLQIEGIFVDETANFFVIGRLFATPGHMVRSTRSLSYSSHEVARLANDKLAVVADARCIVDLAYVSSESEFSHFLPSMIQQKNHFFMKNLYNEDWLDPVKPSKKANLFKACSEQFARVRRRDRHGRPTIVKPKIDINDIGEENGDEDDSFDLRTRDTNRKRINPQEVAALRTAHRIDESRKLMKREAPRIDWKPIKYEE